MNKFKKIDTWISIFLIIACTIISLMGLVKDSFSLFFLTAYFIVGSWQVFSMIIHACNHWFTYNKGKRYAYHWITLLAVVTIPLGSFWLLIFTAPFMAIFYTYICYEEVYVKMQRPLALLK